MRHILNDATDGIDFTGYARYLQTVRNAMPAHVFAFASDPRHFDLLSRSSLHDAWLEELSVREIATGERHEIRRTQVELRLLGPYHDRRIHLLYEGVTGYRWEMPTRHGEPRYEHVAHGDLYTHEICMTDHGLMTHEIEFERDARLVVEFADFRHWETPVDAQ
jgi:hypothetical protein